MTAPRRPPTLRLDGDRIRTLREDKGLTQLYVAEVAGVSVATVSRWENNRTPAVKRENAEALAQALEVEVDQILQPGLPGDGP
ncbi:MAG: helix-turn-helix domain-containing protein, partial [Deferrisomatales bacterium]